MSDRDYLSIGEVLAQLLEEFPDVTISKIRFLESQGLIEPERTPSGYRKFTDSEVERLRFILREQRNNYLPLRVIRDRLDDDVDETGEGVLPYDAVSTSGHPAARGASTKPVPPLPVSAPPSAPAPSLDAHRLEQDIPPSIVQQEQRRIARAHADNTESIPRDDLLRQVDIDPTFLRELEHAGLVDGHDVGDTTFFDARSLEIARVAGRFRDLGIDVRHLRAWKSSADRELGLYEQRILPLLRQRNPAARDEAMSMLSNFVELGNQLRDAILAREISRLTDQR